MVLLTLEIVSISFDAGSVHDFNLFKKTTQELDEFIAFLADSGYQGITELFKNSLILQFVLENYLKTYYHSYNHIQWQRY